MGYLKIDNITKYYGKQKILDDVSLSLDKGKVLSIIGSSGSGKTTLLRCINLLEIPTNGTINIDEDNIFNSLNKYKDSELRKKRLRFGLVFQGFNLFPQYDCLTNITLPLSLREEENRKSGLPYKTKEEILDYAYELLDRVELKEKAKSYPCELSGGQAQRVAISRAIALNPDILCFDEPTSALDPLLTNEVLKVISEIKKTLNKTMIIVTHEMRLAREVSSKVLYIDEGIVFEEGSPEKIFDNPEKKKTRDFIYRISVWNWDSTVRDMDTFKLLSSLEAFCQKQFMDESHFKSCRLLIEEFVSGFVNRKYPDDRVKIAMNLGENDDPMSVEIDISELTGKEKIVNALKKPDKNDLSAKIISSKLYGVPEVNDSKIIWELK